MKCLKQIYKYLCIAGVSVAAWGCFVQDDVEHCPRTVLSFEYLADGTKSVLPDYIAQIDAYIFDEKGDFVKIITLNEHDISISLSTQYFELPAGKYSVVAVGNALSRTSITGINNRNYELVRMTHPAFPSDLQTGIDALYIGKINFVVDDQDWMEYPVRLYAAHSNVYVEVRGTQTEIEGQSPYQIKIAEAVSAVNFNGVAIGDKTDFYPEQKLDQKNNTLSTVDLNLPRMEKSNPLPQLIVTDRKTGNVLLQKSIAEFLAENPDVDIDLQEMTLSMIVEFTPQGVSVKLPEWDIKPVDPEF